MAEAPNPTDLLHHRPWQFSLRGLFALTFGVAIGLSFWKIEQDWYGGTLATISCWIVLGLVAQVGDLWRSLRKGGDLAPDERWGRRFAIVWRLAVCCLIVVWFTLRVHIGPKSLALSDDEDIVDMAFFTTRDMWNAVMLISIIAAVASSPRIARPRRHRPWTWALDLLGVIAACVLLVVILLDRLCLTALVHLTIVCILSAQPLKFEPDVVLAASRMRITQFYDITSAGVGFVLLSCVLLRLLSCRWRPAGWKKVCVGVSCATSLAVMVLLAARIVVVEIPTITPVLAAHIYMPPPLQLAAVSVLVLFLATLVACRWLQPPLARIAPEDTAWRRDVRRYYHERRLLQLFLGGIALAFLVVAGRGVYGFGMSKWYSFGYIFTMPMETLSLALVLLAMQGLFSGWSEHPESVAVEQPRWTPARFLLVWSATLTIIVCAAPILGAWGLAFWLKLGCS